MLKAKLFFFTILAIALPDCAWAQDRSSLPERLQSLSTLSNVQQRRDPFVRAPAPFAPPPTVSAPAPAVPEVEPAPAIDVNAPDLQRYSTDQYKVLAILLGDVYPRALVKTPESKVFVVREKDRLGNRKGYVRRIQEGAMMVVEEVKNRNGSFDKSEVRLALLKGDK